MPETANAVGTNYAPVDLPKRIRVDQVSNGFIVELQNKREYSERRHIASDTDAVMELIRTYLASEE